MKNFFCVMALCVGVSACTYSEGGCMIGNYCLVPMDGGSVNVSNWTPGANATGPVEVVAAKCDMLAHGTVPPANDAMAGATILSQSMERMGHVQNTIKDCMILNGFHKNQ